MKEEIKPVEIDQICAVTKDELEQLVLRDCLFLCKEMEKEKKYPKLIGAIHLVALLGSGKYKICKKEKAEYFASVSFWDKDDDKLRGDFQVFISHQPAN